MSIPYSSCTSKKKTLGVFHDQTVRQGFSHSLHLVLDSLLQRLTYAMVNQVLHSTCSLGFYIHRWFHCVFAMLIGYKHRVIGACKVGEGVKAQNEFEKERGGVVPQEIPFPDRSLPFRYGSILIFSWKRNTDEIWNPGAHPASKAFVLKGQSRCMHCLHFPFDPLLVISFSSASSVNCLTVDPFYPPVEIRQATCMQERQPIIPSILFSSK